MAGNYKSASLQLQNSEQLQNNSINSAMLITINRVKSKSTFDETRSELKPV